MNTNWIKVIVAAVFEVLWVIGLKHAGDVWSWIGTIVAIFISFERMNIDGKKLPVGTGYAVFGGEGTGVTVYSDIVFFGEPYKATEMILIFVLLMGVVGLKLTTKDNAREGVES